MKYYILFKRILNMFIKKVIDKIGVNKIARLMDRFSNIEALLWKETYISISNSFLLIIFRQADKTSTSYIGPLFFDILISKYFSD